MSIVLGVTALGAVRPFLLDSDGRLQTGGGGGGGGAGTSDATEATLQQIRDRLPNILAAGRLSVQVQDNLTVRVTDEAGAAFSALNPLPVELISGASSGSTEATLLEVRNRLPATLVGSRLGVSLFDDAGAAYTTLNPLPIEITNAAVSGGSTETTLLAVRDRLPAALVGGRVGVSLFDETGTAYGSLNPLQVEVTNSVAGGGATEGTLLEVRNRLPAALFGGKVGVSLFDEAGAAFTEANPIFVQVVGVAGTTDTELPTAAVLSDDQTESAVPTVGSRLQSFDGTNWDRVRSGVTAATTTPLGFLNSLPVAQFQDAPANLTEGQFKTLRSSEKGKLLVEQYRYKLLTDIASVSLSPSATSPTVPVQSDNCILTLQVTSDNVNVGAILEIQVSRNPNNAADFITVASETVIGSRTVQFVIPGYVNHIRYIGTRTAAGSVSVNSEVISGV